MIRARIATLRDDDRGTTLLEVVVGMTIMTAFMGMFTAAFVLMSSTVNKVQAETRSSGQINNAFLALDRSVRYASGISAPARSGASNDWNVEYATSVGGTTTCSQLRIHSQQLQRRTWVVGTNGTGYSALTAWYPLASNISNGTVATGATLQPFVSVVTASSPFQRLRITLTATSGISTSGDTQTSMVFTALNSTSTSTTSPCQQVAVDATS